MRPILFHIDSVPIRAYSLMIFIGFAAALFYTRAVARRRMAGRSPDEPGVITPDHIADGARMGLIVGIIGTRVVYVLFNWHEFAGRPLDVFKIWEGGLSFIGAPLFAFPYLAWFCRRHKLPFWGFADLIAPGFPLGQAFGRIGCFLNGCCYGAPCALPWATRFHPDGDTTISTLPSHPSQLYEAAMNFAIFFILDRWSRRRHAKGEMVVAYFMLYSVVRFTSELFRKGGTSDVLAWGLTHAQVISLIALPICALILYQMRKRASSTGSTGSPGPASAASPQPELAHPANPN
jgi:phosphatidylglycerol---prolipoprotein diacylglyceryl transferase